MKRSECKIGDVVCDGHRTMEYIGCDDYVYKFKIITSPNICEPEFSLVSFGGDRDILTLISRKSNSNTNSEIESLKLQLTNIQKQIEKLESENKLEIGSIYEIKWVGIEFKAVLVDIVNDTYKFVSDKNVRYGIHKHAAFTFKKLPDESVKQFFGKKD